MQYCSFRHQTSLLPPDTSTNEQHICFGPAASFFLELLVIALCSSSVSYYASSDLGGSSSHVISSLPFHTFHWVLEARVLKWFGIPFSSWSWMALHSMAHNFLELLRAVIHVIIFVIFLQCGLCSRGCGILVPSSLWDSTPLQYFCLENPMDGGAW